MIGCYDFCGHYEWTFAWIDKMGGNSLVQDYWRESISHDSQRHARQLIVPEGIEGMRKYWLHTLDEEAAGYAITSDDSRFRIDMYECPSKGFLIKNHLEQYSDYCDHCIGWVGPMMKDAGFAIDHEHNHCGQCWWEFRKCSDTAPASDSGKFAEAKDVRLRQEWNRPLTDCFERATDDTGKISKGPSDSAPSDGH